MSKSNFLEVPSTRRDSYKAEAWDFLLSEKLKAAADQAEQDQPSSSKTGKKDDETNMELDDCVEDNLLPAAKKEIPTIIIGYVEDFVTFEEIPWMDKSLVQESINFHNKYFAHEMFCMTAAIIFGFAAKRTSTSVSRKRNEQINHKMYLDYHISTMNFITRFFDFQKKPDDAYDAVLKLRKTHSQRMDALIAQSRDVPKVNESWKNSLVKAVQKDLEYIDTSDATKSIAMWNTSGQAIQLDIISTQLGYWLYMWLFPSLFGIANRAKEMRGIIHVWAVFGRLMGVQDEHNICLLNLETAEASDLYDKLFRAMIIESLKTINVNVVTLQSNFIRALRPRMPIVTYKAILYFGLRQCEGFKGKNLWKVMSWRDVASVLFFQVVFFLIRHSKYCRLIVNYFVYFWFQLCQFLYLPGKNWKEELPQYLKNWITLKLY